MIAKSMATSFTLASVSPTLAINELTARRRAAGLPTIALGFGEAGLPVLPGLVQRLADSGARAEYGPVSGIPQLREAAAGYWDRRQLATDPELVVAGPGSKSLLYALLHALAGPVALPCPSWVSYAAQAALVGCRTWLVATRPCEGGVPAPQRLDAVARRAAASGEPLRAVILTLPDNPTGTLASPATVTALCELAERHDLLIISDEIYRDLVHDPGLPFLSPAALAPDRTVITSGLSKNLALGGWRLGVARFPDSEPGRRLRAHVLRIASELWSAPAQPVQRAAAWALTEPPEVRERVAASRRLHGIVARATSDVLAAAGVDHPPPAGAFYLYPDLGAQRERLAAAWSIRTGTELATWLLDRHGIATLPASAFGEAETTLALRLASSQLYGETDERRACALHDPQPRELPWIAEQLQVVAGALDDLVGKA